ncbi:peptidase M16 [Oleidesulfovibrio alaskensis]|jgi:SpoU rRNA methylase family enzyme
MNNTAVLIKGLELAAKYGVPAVIEAVKTLGKESVTLADIAELEGLVKRPESYFTDTPDEAA